MNASLENCKRLYELSGWQPDKAYDNNPGAIGETIHFSRAIDANGKLWPGYTPAYDLGYLLRKLPVNLEYIHREKDFIDGSDLPEVKIRGNVYVGFTAQNKATAGYGSMQGHFYLQYADTPEDALTLLAIKLFEEGIL